MYSNKTAILKCRICGQEARHRIDTIQLTLKNTAEVFNGAHCQNCNSISYYPFPSNKSIRGHYGNEYSFYRGGNIKQIGRGVGFEKLYLSKIGDAGKILDVGCGSADFLYGLSLSKKWSCHGIDINLDSVNAARERTGLTIYHGDIFSNELQENNYDALHLRDVIEHVPNPIEFMRRAHELVKPNGFIYVRIPNGINEYRSKLRTFKRTKSPVLSNPGHVYYVSIMGFEMLCKLTNFEVVDSFSFGLKNGLRNLGLWPIPKRQKSSLKSDSFNQTQDPKRLDQNINKDFLTKSTKKFIKEETSLIKGRSRFTLEHIYILKAK